MYGETASIIGAVKRQRGLSPHVRGNQGRRLGGQAHHRSIPACTGKPTIAAAVPHPREVYPRMYGETPCSGVIPRCRWGLSPHVRGNRSVVRRRPRRLGSIPACTGKPLRRKAGARAGAVYPRMYGETERLHCLHSTCDGLSPHVRGNRRLPRIPLKYGRSIPACTGKPGRRGPGAVSVQVYPRMYGETRGLASHSIRSPGLSPHVRGNRQLHSPAARAVGSIPACTGKPQSELPAPP